MVVRFDVVVDIGPLVVDRVVDELIRTGAAVVITFLVGVVGAFDGFFVVRVVVLIAVIKFLIKAVLIFLGSLVLKQWLAKKKNLGNFAFNFD